MRFCNIYFKGLTKDQVLSENADLKVICTVNAQFIVLANQNPRFLNILNNNYSTFDGQIPYLFAKLLKSKKLFFEKVSGSEIVYDFIRLSKEKNLKLFFLGGSEVSNSAALEKINNDYDISVEGFSPEYCPYPFTKIIEEQIKSRLIESKPKILFVGFGAPKQELWIDDNKVFLNELGVKWVVGCGGTFDFISGKFKRAPKIVQKIGLEGVWRLFQQFSYERIIRLVISLKFLKYL